MTSPSASRARSELIQAAASERCNPVPPHPSVVPGCAPSGLLRRFAHRNDGAQSEIQVTGMCSLCGVLGSNEHWTDAVARPGVYTRNLARAERRRERANRGRLANQVLSSFALSLSDWQGTSFLLSTRTGKTEIIDDLGHLWPTAE